MNTDHNLLVAHIKLKLKRQVQSIQHKLINLSLLKYPETFATVSEAINSELRKLKTTDMERSTNDENWGLFF